MDEGKNNILKKIKSSTKENELKILNSKKNLSETIYGLLSNLRIHLKSVKNGIIEIGNIDSDVTEKLDYIDQYATNIVYKKLSEWYGNENIYTVVDYYKLIIDTYYHLIDYDDECNNDDNDEECLKKINSNIENLLNLLNLNNNYKNKYYKYKHKYLMAKKMKK